MGVPLSCSEPDMLLSRHLPVNVGFHVHNLTSRFAIDGFVIAVVCSMQSPHLRR